MRDVARIPTICNKLQALWSKYPDQRFFQLISNLMYKHEMQDRMFFVEDTELEICIDQWLQSMQDE